MFQPTNQYSHHSHNHPNTANILTTLKKILYNSIPISPIYNYFKYPHSIVLYAKTCFQHNISITLDLIFVI